MRVPAMTGEVPGFLVRLREDVRGNTLAFMAAMLLPLMAFVGSAVDMARIYAVKTRLQQACDAGVLAGRKAMMESAGDTLNSEAITQADNFFKNNLPKGWFQVNDAKLTSSKVNADQVQGVATATVPMTLMTIFGQPGKRLTVNCEARYDVPDADVMFVLDTTGSMAEVLKGDAQSKIDGLRAAVVNFYKTLKNSADPSTHIRYGFVTYSSAVNVGGLLPRSALVDNWSYDTRIFDNEVLQTGKSPQVTATYSGKTKAQCDAYDSRDPATGFKSDGSAVRFTTQWDSSGACIVTRKDIQAQWRYGRYPVDVSAYINTLQGGSIPDPSKLRENATAKWQGCVEERDTFVATSFDQLHLPADLDPDLAPTSNATRWRPMYPEIVYVRKDNGSNTVDTSPNDNDADDKHIFGEKWPLNANKKWNNPAYAEFGNVNSQSGQDQNKVSCGKPATRLAVMSQQDVENYVYASDFFPHGTTFHDAGMIWGTRLISPTGLFKADTAAWPGHDEPARYIVFMTDGEMNADRSVYGMYGLEYYDQLTTGSSTDGNKYHNARFLAECTAAKNRNITVFVIGFGTPPNASLVSCASSGQAYFAKDTAKLNDAFTKIAGHIAALRLSK